MDAKIFIIQFIIKYFITHTFIHNYVAHKRITHNIQDQEK